MSAHDYYGGGSSDQRAHQQQQHQHAQQGSNPYGYPESSTPQPYYGQNEGVPHGGYNQQPYPSYDYQNQQSGGYGTQSYNYQQQQQQPYAPPAYDNLYPPMQHHDSDQKSPSHEQYANQYDSSRQQGYELYGQPSQYGHPNVSVPPHEVRADTNAQMDPNAPPGAEGERGLMGALAGGALGAYGGHKMGHGVLGALGGAYAGHKLEDAVKDKKKEKKKHKHGDRDERRARREERRRHRRERRGSRDSSSSSSSSSSDSDSDKEKRKHGSHKYAAAGAGAYAASHHSKRDVGRHGTMI